MTKVVLLLKLPINRYEYVETVLCKRQQCAVFTRAPASLGYSLHRMARECLSQPGGDTLV